MLVLLKRDRLPRLLWNLGLGGLNQVAVSIDTGDNRIRSLFAGLPRDSAVFLFEGESFFSTTKKGSWTNPHIANKVLGIGSGVTVLVPKAATIRWTGEVRTNLVPLTLNSGIHLLGSQLPGGGSYETVVGRAPFDGVKLYLWDGPEWGEPFEFNLGRWSPEEPVFEEGVAVYIEIPDEVGIGSGSEVSGEGNVGPLESVDLQLIGDWPERLGVSRPSVVAADGALLVVGGGFNEGISVLDFSEQARGQELARVPTDGIVRSIVLREELAFFTANAFHILSLADPRAPKIVGGLNSGGDLIAIKGDLMFLSGGFAHFEVVDISQPSNPHVVGEIELPGVANEMALIGDSVVLSLFDGRLVTLNVENPTSPELIGEPVRFDIVASLASIGTKLYVADPNWGLFIYDYEDPNDPIELENYPELRPVLDLDVHEGTLLGLGRRSARLWELDHNGMLIESSRVEVKGLVDGFGEAIWLGERVFVVSQVGGIEVVDFSDRINPSLTRLLNPELSVNDVSEADRVLYVASEMGGITSWRAGEFPPILLSSNMDLDSPKTIEWVGGYLVATTTDSVHVFSRLKNGELLLTDSRQRSDKTLEYPELIRIGDRMGVQEQLQLDLYEVDSEGGLRLVSEYRVDAPTETSEFDDELGLIALKNNLVEIVSVSPSGKLQFRTEIETDHPLVGVALGENRAYVVDSQGLLEVFDLSDLERLSSLGEIELTGAGRLKIYGNYLLLNWGAVSALDIRDPQRITQVGESMFSGRFPLKLGADGRFYSVSRSAGVRIYQFFFPERALNIVNNEGGVELRWLRGELETAGNVDGPWEKIEGAESPFGLSLDEPKRFYRVGPQ